MCTENTKALNRNKLNAIRSFINYIKIEGIGMNRERAHIYVELSVGWMCVRATACKSVTHSHLTETGNDHIYV